MPFVVDKLFSQMVLKGMAKKIVGGKIMMMLLVSVEEQKICDDINMNSLVETIIQTD